MKPKRGLSAYLYFNGDAVAKFKEEGHNHKDAFKMAGDKWKTLSDKEKEPFMKMQATDQARYEKQLAELEKNGYFMQDGVKSTDMVNLDPKKKYGPDVLLPKRALGSYMYFTQDRTKSIAEKEKIPWTEATKRAGEIWSKLSEKEKKPYEDKHAKDEIRYQKQMDDLMKKGFFLLDDGTKSSDQKAKQKKKRASKIKNDTESEDSKPNKKIKAAK